ncbi:Amiloride-sensitive sodium channel subunit gamma-2 [Stylophora pistillata]|uniref:Amiloride-sensitive sodium channel subunit gamma-2 n=1 Tax=Stylophora pistillata TaxID=50429 RepID=A0A2B4SP90_STYPI|nr:Amiloride-sensitive sodium channel subunit gamma-2 [Stylophora pistillata]
MSSGKIVHDNYACIPGAVGYSENSSEIKEFPLKKKTTEIQESQGDFDKAEPSSFKKLLTHFAATTTAHGVGRIANAKSSLVRRLVWSLVSVGLYATLFWMCIALVVLYVKKPIVSRTEMSFEESLDFPAVTICNFNMLRKEKLEILQKTILPWVIASLAQRSGRRPPSSEQRVNITSINATEDAMRQQIQAQGNFMKESLLSKATNSYEKEILSNAEVDTKSLEKNFLDKVLKSIPEDELSKVGHDLDEMLKYCRWSSFNCKTGSLRMLWRQFWHWNYGNCFILNSGLTENGTKVPAVMNSDRGGPNNGLELDIFIDQESYTKLTDEAGVRVVLTDQSRMPFPFDEGFSIPTGFATSVGIKRKFVKRVDPYLNNSCVDEGRTGMDTRTIYTEKYYVNYSTQARLKYL